MADALERWARQLGAWSIPPEILERAPESPWGFPPALFARAAERARGQDTPARRAALEALGDGGTVLDVGVGGGAASLPLVPPATEVTGVDADQALLRTFTGGAERAGVAHTGVLGRWPDVATQVGAADVVVCHHVLYNVADLAPFVAALTDHARRRVVCEVTARHPRSSLNPLWRRFHGLDLPDGPTADDLVAALRACGLDPVAVSSDRPPAPPPATAEERAELVAFTRRRLCLPEARHAEVDAALGPRPQTTVAEVAALWWPGTAGQGA